MDHLTKIRDNELSRIKESCVNGQTCKVPDEYKAFVSEWRESLAMGIASSPTGSGTLRYLPAWMSFTGTTSAT